MRPAYLTVLLVLWGCHHRVLEDLNTGLTGSVMRTPITPVCDPKVSCSAPFSAHFTVWQGSHPVTTFLTDADGRFTVRLEPGAYRIVPGPDCPILDPGSQTRSVVVGPSQLTTVLLDFDTGLR